MVLTGRGDSGFPRASKFLKFALDAACDGVGDFRNSSYVEPKWATDVSLAAGSAVMNDENVVGLVGA